MSRSTSAKKDDTSKVVATPTAPLHRLLSHVALGGMVDECVLVVKKGIGTVQATDLSGALYVEASEQLDIDDITVGLSNLRMLVKFLEGDGDYSFELSNTWAVFRRRNHGTIRSQIIDPEQVATAVQQDEGTGTNGKRLLKQTTARVTPSKEAITNFLYYAGLVKGNNVLFNIRKNKLTIASPQTETTQYMLQAGAAESDVEDTSVAVYTAPLVAILNIASGNSELRFHIGAGNPLIVTVPGALWAVTPIMQP